MRPSRKRSNRRLTRRQVPTMTELVLPLAGVDPGTGRRRGQQDGQPGRNHAPGCRTWRCPRALPSPRSRMTAFFPTTIFRRRSTGACSPWKWRTSRIFTAPARRSRCSSSAPRCPRSSRQASTRPTNAWRPRPGQVRVALRSSAIGEDAAGHLLRRPVPLGVQRRARTISSTSYKEILASKYALTAMSTGCTRGCGTKTCPCAWAACAMVDAAAGGVMYSRDPINIRRDSILINAVHGLAKSVVDGSVTPDLWVVSRGDPLTIIRKEIRDKEAEGGVPAEGRGCSGGRPGGEDPGSDRRSRPWTWPAWPWSWRSISRAPQDIEWSIDRQGRVFILQSRPLKQLTQAARDEAAAPAAADHPVILRGGETACPGVAAGRPFWCGTTWICCAFRKGRCWSPAFAHPSWATLLTRAAAVSHRPGRGHRASGQRGPGVRHPGPVQYRGCHPAHRPRGDGHRGRGRPCHVSGAGWSPCCTPSRRSGALCWAPRFRDPKGGHGPHHAA